MKSKQHSRKALSAVILTIAIVFMFNSNVYAYSLLSGYYTFFSYDIPVAYQQKGTRNDSSYINSAILRWNAVVNLTVYRDDDWGGARIGIDSNDYGNTTWVGKCIWPNFLVCDWAYIKINDYHLTRGSYPVGDSINATLHEMGHAFGVDHSSNSSNLMYGSVNGTIVYPQQDDKNGVNAVYP